MIHATDVTRNLPSRDDVLRAVGLERARSGSDLLGSVAVFGAGMLVGAGLALLLAPESVARVREQIATRVEDAKEKVAAATGARGGASATAGGTSERANG